MLSDIAHNNSILIIDYIAGNIVTLEKSLTDFGYQVLVAEDIKKAIAIAEEADIDFILWDFTLLESIGVKCYYLFKKKLINKDVPIVLMTTRRAKMDKIRGWKSGKVDYIEKPINLPKLLAKIDTHLTIKRLHRQLANEVKNKQIIRNITNRICQSLDLDFIFQTTIEKIIKVLKCDRLTIVSLENEGMSVKAQSVAQKTTGKLPRKLDFNYCNTLIKQHQNCPKIEVRVVKTVDEANNIAGKVEAQLSAPILLKKAHRNPNQDNSLWGWLIVEQASPRQWQLEEIDLIRSLTAQLSVPLRQNLLYQQLKQDKQQLEIVNKELESTNEDLKELTLLDSLTKIFNRRYFEQHLHQEWRRLQRNAPSHLSLIICDVDCFKIYNDTYGHKQGDKCLQKLATTLSQVLKRPADILARYGGEEFAVVLPDTDETGAVKIAESMRKAVEDLKLSHLNSNVASIVTVSLGVASIVFETQNTPDLLVEAADQALYQAKSRGRNCLGVYQDDVSQSMRSQNNELYWSQRIRQALEQNLFILYAQPIVSLKESDRQQHFEILLRLTDSGANIVSPDAFFEIAARNSLMSKIDVWVVDNLLKIIEESSNNWQNHHYSINLSGASLNNQAFLQYLIQKLNDCHLPSNIFCFEITETIAIDNLDTVSKFINSVKNLGCSFALDDFGKGMSSLSYLKNLPIDYLKIDGSFIKELHQDETSKTIVEGIHHIAKGMDLKTVAEFVENKEILDVLQNLKVDYAQGYYLGYPQKLVDILS